MNRLNRFVFYILVYLSLGINLAVAADITFNASVDRTTVPLDEHIQLTLEVLGSSGGGNPVLPQLTNLRIVGTYQSSNISIVNGQVNVARSFIYTLAPEQVGEAEIASASIVIGGQTYTTQPIKITVVGAKGKKTQPQSPSRSKSVWDDFDDFFNSPFPHQRWQEPEVIKDPIKVDLKVSHNTAYVNQQILLTFSFYRRVNLAQNPSYTPPDTTGFWAINLSNEESPREVILDGVKYMVQDFKTVLFPTTAGNFTISPATLVVQIEPFSPAETIKTNPLKINILPLPKEGKPKNFSGVVGDYRMDVQLKKNKVERGQPIQITVKISGNGNIQTISEPIIELPVEFKKLSAIGKENIIKGNNGISGSKSFEMVLIPLKEGRFTLPPFEFSYFDPMKKEYRTIKSQKLSVNILPSSVPLPKEYEENLVQESSKQPVAIVIPWHKIGTMLFKITTSIFFWLPATIILITLIAFIISRNYQKRLAADPLKLRQRQAIKVAKKRLKTSLRLLKQNKMKEFIGEIFNTMANYLGDKYGFSGAGITTDGLKKILEQKGLTIEVQEQLEIFIFECDLLRFTPSSLSHDKANHLAQMAENLIIVIEKGEHLRAKNNLHNKQTI